MSGGGCGFRGLSASPVVRLIGLLGSVAIIVFATLFSFGGAAPGETQAVRFCIVCSEHWLADAISNVLLFLPFGASLSAPLSAPRP